MLNQEKLREYANIWADDLDKNSLRVGEIDNVDVINQSIEMILATPLGTRLFNLGFGSDFSLRIFDNMDIQTMERLLKDTIDAIGRWEDRIVIIKDKVSFISDADRNTLTLTIPYYLKQRRIMGEFTKVISQ